MKRSTVLFMLTLALWIAALSASWALTVPVECAICHVQVAPQVFSSPQADNLSSNPVFTIAPRNPNAPELGRMRVNGSLFSDSPGVSGTPTFGKSASPREVYSFATTGLRG